MAIKTKPFDAARYFPDRDAQLRLLTDALEEGDPAYIAAAIGTIAKARGFSDLAAATGLSRQSLHKALALGGNPRLDTLMRVLDALDLQLSVAPKSREMADA